MDRSGQIKLYRNPDITRRDILQVMHHYKGLIPKVDNLVFSTGERKELVCLDGTIPVLYKGNVYNIPVCIWLLETHPYNAPVCFVKPTSDMQIKVSTHVDQSGKIYLPYLHDWKHNVSDLVGLIQVMIVVFGEQPPVYAKSRTHGSDYASGQTHAQAHTTTTPYPSHTSATPYMPMPGGQMASQYSPYPYQTAAAGTSMPPYPMGSTSYKYTAPGTTPTSNASNNPPPIPSYPTSNMPYYPYPNPAPTNYPPTHGSMYPTASYPGYGTTQPSSTAPTGASTISEEHIKASLQTAVEDKMKRRLREIFAQAQAEMEVLKRTQDELTRGKAKLEDMINRIENEQLELDKNITMLKDKNDAMSDVIAKLQSQETVDVDEAVVTTAPLYKQLLNAFAEENATEDAIYYLGEALRRGTIDLDLFLKHVRELSRKQFMLRALMQKCREKASLPC